MYHQEFEHRKQLVYSLVEVVYFLEIPGIFSFSFFSWNCKIPLFFHPLKKLNNDTQQDSCSISSRDRHYNVLSKSIQTIS